MATPIQIQGFFKRAPFDAARAAVSVRRAIDDCDDDTGDAGDAGDAGPRTDAVVRAVASQLRRRAFETAGCAVSAEELKDVVELCMMACGEYAAAKRYIILRFRRDVGLD